MKTSSKMKKCIMVIISALCVVVLTSIRVEMYFLDFLTTTKELDPYKRMEFRKITREKPHKTANVTKILVVAYMRSGSSFTAESLQHGPGGSFYSFEPFHGICTRPMPTLPGLVCKGKNASVPRRTMGLSQTAVSIIKNIFECQMSALADEVLHDLSVSPQLQIPKECKTCFKNSEIFTKRTHDRKPLTELKSKCLSILESKCRNSTVRVIKTIRMPLQVLGDLLVTEGNIKILHLMRDPRAIVNSRRRLGLNYPDSNVKELCNRMSRDVEEGQKIGYNFPGRFYSIRYECLSRNPDTVLPKLYSDMSLQYGTKTVQWMEMYMKSHNLHQKGYSVFRSNSTNWRLRIPFNVSKKIDTLCGEVYSKIGTRLFRFAMELENLEISDMYVTSYTKRYCA